jgi:hypothetical protein
MLSVILAVCHMQALYAKCHYAECRYTEFPYVECCGTLL